MNRRLPVYILIDCSESMAGGAFEAVKIGLATMLKELRSDPMALETAAISVITFSNQARVVVPLTDIIKVQIPTLRLGSGTAMGAALELWLQCMEKEVVKTTVEQKGDYKPLCFILTDGEPTDKWEVVADKIRTTITCKKANVIAVACGPDADTKTLGRITETVIAFKDEQTSTFSKFFKWVTASISITSQKIEGAGDKPLGLPGLSPDCMEVLSKEEQISPLQDRYAFLHAKCTKNQKFYLMRFRRTDGPQERRPVYSGTATHPMDDFEMDTDGKAKELKVNSDQLEGDLPCPYCGGQLWAFCGACGHVHCAPMTQQDNIKLTCPWCGKTGIYSFGSFDVGRGRG